MDTTSTRGPYTHLSWCTAGECVSVSSAFVVTVNLFFAFNSSGIVCPLSSGVGRTGAFCLLYAALQELEAGNGIPDLPLLVKRMRQQRKNMLQEKVRVVRVFHSCCRSARCSLYLNIPVCVCLQLHLKFCYEAVLKHAEQVLQRHGITSATCSKNTNAAAAKV